MNIFIEYQDMEELEVDEKPETWNIVVVVTNDRDLGTMCRDIELTLEQSGIQVVNIEPDTI